MYIIPVLDLISKHKLLEKNSFCTQIKLDGAVNKKLYVTIFKCIMNKQQLFAFTKVRITSIRFHN